MPLHFKKNVSRRQGTTLSNRGQSGDLPQQSIDREVSLLKSVEAMMMDELKKFEKELKKPLLRNDKKGMDILLADSDKVNQK
ncbi:hypothetical protein M0R45_010759 [Rubus argutus]|uniref:Uncharacterized protein n=1 Tax=Rubus argutus TaxID=59490 RepID=A0AAW1Y858_RUBAR